MSNSNNDRTGQKVSSYHLLRLIGQGGFADVYLGEHIYLKTLAAIKILHIRADNADRPDILNEARAIAQLEHPNIVRLFEFGIENGYPFLIMSYAARGSLRDYHPKGARLPIDLVIMYAQQIASALDYAHQNKLIHRDVKPANMLLGQKNQVLLTDFGLVIMAQATHSKSSENLAEGTVAYMAPEQLRGHPRFASDQYALGVVVYEWLCGKRPFVGSFVEVASQHMLESPPSMCAINPTLKPEIEQVVFKALAKDPAERFASVGDFASALSDAHNKPSPFPTDIRQLSGSRLADGTLDQFQPFDTEKISALPQLTSTTSKLNAEALPGPEILSPAVGTSSDKQSMSGPTPPTPPTVSITKKRVRAFIPSEKLIVPDPFPALQASSSPGNTLTSNNVQVIPDWHKKTLKSTIIIAVLLLALGGGVTYNLNKFMNAQKPPIHINQNNKLTSTATIGEAQRVIGTNTGTYPANTPINNINTRSAGPAVHTPLPNSTPNVPEATTVPASQPDGSTPTTPTPDTGISPTDTPTTSTTPDTNSTTPDTNSSPTVAPTATSTQTSDDGNGNGNGNNGNGNGNNGNGKGKGKSGK